MNSFKFSNEMKVPTKPAPPPPTANSWTTIFGAKDKSQKNSLPKKKPPPPRPPPPKFTQPRPNELRGGSQLVSGLFPRSQSRAIHEPVGSLIDLSSPPSSPTSTTRSSSDALSVNSFGSDSVAPSSGSTSNVESGFEDDFELYGAPASRQIDPWSPPPAPVKAPTLVKPASSTWVTFTSNAPKKHIMPTIIRAKPERPKVPKILEKKMEMAELAQVFENTRLAEQPGLEVEEEDGWSLDSPPMPTCPPPAPPPEVLAGLLEESLHPKSHKAATQRNLDTAVALYDYHGAAGDLSFRQGDRVQILRRIDEHWVEAQLAGLTGTAPVNHLQMEISNPFLVTALYSFPAETWEDLALEPGMQVLLHRRVNNEWLYGESSGKQGQFPAAFVDHIPENLPLQSS